MKRILAISLAAVVSLAVSGCGQTAKVKETHTTSTPGGTTTTVNETTVKKTGDNPPPARP
jgi:hypothetical protein